MDFKLNIGTLEETINKYDNLINVLKNQKEIINKVIMDLGEQGWSGEAKDKFVELHDKYNNLYERLLEDVNYMWNALENEEKPRAIQLKMRCEDFINCIRRNSNGMQGNINSTGIISLDFGGLNSIQSHVDKCIGDYNKTISDDFVDILDTLNSLEYTLFGIGSDIEFVGQTSLKNQCISLKDFKESFIQYNQGVKNMESNICSVLAKVSGITTEITSTGKDSILLDNGEINVEKIKEILNKNPEDLSDGEIEFIEYAIKLMDEDEYKKLKENIDKDISNENIDFMTSYLKKLLPDKISQGEKIIISGNCDGEHAARNFIETAIKQINDWQVQDDKDITWIITNSGYTEKDIKLIKEVEKEKNINLIFINNADTIIDYMNTGKDNEGTIIENRVFTKISDISIFSHGLRDDQGTLALDYFAKKELRNDNLNITNDELQNYNINKDCFNDTYTYFGSCNSGTVQNGKSFASEWVKKVGGKAQAICDPTPEDEAGGQTTYEYINNNNNFAWKSIDWIRRNIFHTNFNKNGCDNYLLTKDNDENKDVYWTEIHEDGTVEKIDGVGGPR